MDYRSFHNSDSLFSMGDSWEFNFTSCVLVKTTCCFMENDVLFYGKRRVVLWKVTCCFMESDVLFYGKRRVVLWEMTCRFRAIGQIAG